MLVFGLDSSSLEQGPVHSSCEHSNVHSDSGKCGESLNYLSNYLLVKDDSSALSEPINLLACGVFRRDQSI